MATGRSAPAAAEDQFVAPAQAGDCELQPAQPIAFVWIGAGEVEDEIGLVAVQHVGQCASSTARYSSSPVPSASATSRSLTSFRNGKFCAPCIENVNTDGSSRKMAAVPLPW